MQTPFSLSEISHKAITVQTVTAITEIDIHLQLKPPTSV